MLISLGVLSVTLHLLFGIAYPEPFYCLTLLLKNTFKHFFSLPDSLSSSTSEALHMALI